MLNKILKLERIVSAPAGAWWQGQLWLAYRNLSEVLTIRSIPVLGDPSLSQAYTPSLSVPRDPALTAWAGRLWLAFSAPDGDVRLTSSADGQNFTPPQSLGFATEYPLALAGTDSGLWLAWAEQAGGLVHLLSSSDGVTFDDIGVSVHTRCAPALAWDVENHRLALLLASRPGGANSLLIALVDPDSPDPGLPVYTTSPTPEQPFTLAAAFVGGHGGRRLLLASSQLPPAGGGQIVEGRTLSADLTKVGGAETFDGGTAHGHSLTPGGIRVSAAWRSAFQDDLMVAPYDLAFDLPPELGEKLRKECDPKDCPPDPRLVCEPTDEIEWKWEPPYIPNARKGDLILTPADGVGMVGTLLTKAQPTQFYDHMGIMVEDQILVRHATMGHDRIKKKEYYTGKVLGIEPAPTDGLRPDLITYGWPGTITQTVDDAFYTGFDSWSPRPGAPPETSLNPRWDFYAFNPTTPKLVRPKDTDKKEVWDAYWKDLNPRRLFFDPERPADSYSIHNFPNAPQFRMDIDGLVFGRVVKPHPQLEAADPDLRPTLHRVAAAAEQIDGHYRFFSYSKARIALPGPGSLRAPAATDAKWGNLPTGARWAAGSEAVVCSSFVWAAVRKASQTPPRLELEGTTTESPSELLGTPPEDGLYRYKEDERRDAANALYEYLSHESRKQVRQNLMALADKFDWAVALSKFGIAYLVALLKGPVGIAAAAIGCTPTHVADLALLFDDMPNKLGNQMCNVFAFDKADDVNGDGWKNPGDGLAVGPDDVWLFWDAPSPSDREVRRGLWGHSELLLLVEGRFEPRHKHRFGRAHGLALVKGRVLYGETPLVGADVRIGCDKDVTHPIGDFPMYSLEVPAGRHEIVAGAYWPATNWWLSARQVVDVQPGENTFDITLEEPPQWRRIVRIFGKLDLVHRVLIGHDDWLHQPIVMEARLSWAPATWRAAAIGRQQDLQSFQFLSDTGGQRARPHEHHRLAEKRYERRRRALRPAPSGLLPAGQR